MRIMRIKNKKIIFAFLLSLFLVAVLMFVPKSLYNRNIKKNVSYSDIKEEANIVNDSNVGEPYINPKWEEYMNLSEEEKKAWDVIPSKYIVDYVPKKKSYFNFSTPYSTEVIPESYNLRNDGVATSIYNQGNAGLCWAYSTISTVESTALKTLGNNLTFSVKQLDYATAMPTSITENYNPYSLNRNITSGGWFTNKLFASGISPVLTSKFNVSNSSPTTSTKQSMKNVFDTSNVDYSISEYTDFPIYSNDDSFKNIMKKHIMDYGAISVSTVVPDSRGGECNYGSLIMDNGECDGADNDIAHMMIIIGWDDNYSYNYCNLPYISMGFPAEKHYLSTQSQCTSAGGTYTSAQGAWILQNSWGNNKTYPYLAYQSNIYELYGIKTIEEKNWDNNYDNTTKSGKILMVNSKTEIQTYNKLANNDEILKYITFYTMNQNETYNAYISTTGNDSDMVLLDTIVTELPGTYKVSANSNLLNSNKFSIKLVSTNNNIAFTGTIKAFTSNSVQTEQKLIDTSFINDKIVIDSTKTKQNMEFYSNTRNVDTGELLTFSVYNSNGEDITNSLSFFNDNKYSNYILNNSQKGSFDFNYSLGTGTYTLKTKNNGAVVDSTDFKVGYPKSITLNNPILDPTILYDNNSGTITIPVTTFEMDNGTTLNVVIKNSGGVDVSNNFTISGTAVNNNSTNIIIQTTPNTLKGSYTIEVSVDDFTPKTKTFVINEYINIQSISLNKSTSTILKDSSDQLTVTYNPTNVTNKEVTWTSSDEDVATVNSTGIISGLSRGTTTITATSEDENKTASCVVTVEEPKIILGTKTIIGSNITTDTSKMYYGYEGTIEQNITKQDIYNNINVVIKNSENVDRTTNFGITQTNEKITINTPSNITSGEYMVYLSYMYTETKSFNFVINSPIKVSSITQEDITINLNESITLLPTILPNNVTDKRIKYTATNPDVVTITSSGVITGLSKGTTSVEMRAENGNGKISCFNINVIEPLLNPGNYSIVDNTYLILPEKTTKNAFSSQISASSIGYIQYTEPQMSYIGTGLTVSVMSRSSHNQLSSYTVIVKGDIDGDGDVTAGDAYDIIFHSIGKRLLNSRIFKAADIDVDSNINAADAYDIILYSIGKKNSL